MLAGSVRARAGIRSDSQTENGGCGFQGQKGSLLPQFTPSGFQPCEDLSSLVKRPSFSS